MSFIVMCILSYLSMIFPVVMYFPPLADMTKFASFTSPLPVSVNNGIAKISDVISVPDPEYPFDSSNHFTDNPVKLEPIIILHYNHCH